jgi:hypothetical protein
MTTHRFAMAVISPAIEPRGKGRQTDHAASPAALARRQDTGRLRRANGQALACIYSRENEAEAMQAKVLTADARGSRPISRGCRSCCGPNHDGAPALKSWCG